MAVRLTKYEGSSEKEDDKFQVDIATSDKLFTVEEAVEACGFGWFQIRLSVFAGLIWMIDAMELMVLAILASEARCDYDLTTWQESLITTVVFGGMTIGAGLWGKFMDKYGRRRGLFVFCVFVALMSLLSAFAPNYPTLIAFRGLVGLGVAGSSQAVTFYAEFVPAKSRAYCLIFIEVFFAFGTFLEVLLALVVLAHFHMDWHWLLGFTAVPMFVDLLAFGLVPESARYLVASNKIEKAREVLERIARINGKKLPEGRLVPKHEKEKIETNTQTQNPKKDDDRKDATENGDGKATDSDTSDTTERLINQSGKHTTTDRGRFADLFSTKTRTATTVLLWIIWFGSAFGYYGVVLLTTEILNIINEQGNKTLTVNSTYMNSSSSISSSATADVLQCIDAAPAPTTTCSRLKTDDYVQVLWTTTAEFPGLLLTVFLIERIGRKKTMALEFFLAVLFFLLMYICPIHKVLLMMFIFGARSVLTGTFQAAFVYTPEVYPTSVRALGVGACSSVSFFGAMLTPFVAEVLLRKTLRGGEGLYAAVCVVGGICALLLPIETKGRELRESTTIVAD